MTRDAQITNANRLCYLQFFVRLDHIRKCFTQKDGIFVLEEFSKWHTEYCIDYAFTRRRYISWKKKKKKYINSR